MKLTKKTKRIIMGMAVLTVIGMFIPEEGTESEANTTKVEEVKELTTEEIVKEAATKVFGEDLKACNYTYDEKGSTVVIMANENYSFKATKLDSYYVMKNIKENLKENNIVRYEFCYFCDMVDTYGNVDNIKVHSFGFNADDINKINFKNVEFNGLYDNFANDIYLHQNFK